MSRVDLCQDRLCVGFAALCCDSTVTQRAPRHNEAHPPSSPHHRVTRPATKPNPLLEIGITILLPAIVLMFVLGIWPQLLLKVINPTVVRVVDSMKL